MSHAVNVLHIDAFSTIPNKGNPAGVVLEAAQLTGEQMQEVAKQVGFNETVFVMPSDQADLKLKYYTPGHEMNLCGHATMASIYALLNFNDRYKEHMPNTITIETNVGVLPVTIQKQQSGGIYIQMKQAAPQFIPYRGDTEKLMWSMGLDVNVLHPELPIMYGNTGAWTLLVPLKNLACFADMIPRNEAFPALLTEMPTASLHPFCIGAHDVQALMHARHFSSPFSGTVEDPATGTASGVMGAYYLQYMDQEISRVSFTVEQGTEMERNGRVHVEAIRNDEQIDIYVAGTAVYVDSMAIELS